MQKIWFIFNFTILALLIWDVINASPRQLISQCRKLSLPFHQNSVTLAPLRSVVMQLGYQGNPKLLIIFCYIAARQKFLFHKSCSLFPEKKEELGFSFLEKGWTGLLNGGCGTRCSWTQQHCMLLLPNTCYIAVNWLIAETSLLLQV